MIPNRPAGKHRTSKWYAYDAPNERLRLFSASGIAGFGLVVMLGLYLVFPRQGLETRLANTARTDLLTVEYLKAFIAAQPDSPRLRLLLARQLMGLGRYGDARSVLEPFSRAPMDEDRVEAELYEFDMREREAFALAPESTQRALALRAATAHLSRLTRLTLTPAQAEFLAARAIALGENRTALDLYARMAQATVRAPGASAEMARTALGLGGYEVAAQFYFRAQERSLAIERKREYYMAGVATLMSGNLYDQAIDAADRNLGPLADDPETLKFLARTAQAANRADAAQRYARRLLRMAWLERLRQHFAGRGIALAAAGHVALPSVARFDARDLRQSVGERGPGIPFDEEAYTLGFNIFVAAGNLADAQRVAESAVAQVPESAEWRKRLATVAEWHGAPRVALTHWLAHARLTGDAASWEAVLRLGRGLFDDQAVLAALTFKLERTGGAALGLIDEIVAIHERLGDPEAALAFLKPRAVASLRRPVLERLLALAERAGRDALAFDTLLTLQREYGPTLAWAERIAARHYLTGDLRAALAALDEVAGLADDRAVSYWQTVAELARLLQMDEKAIAGYRRLLAAEKYSEGDLANLVALLDAMRPAQAARVAEFAFDRFGRADLALQVIYQYTRSGDRAAVGRFLARLSGEVRAQLERDVRFLAARASHHQGEGDLRAALADWLAMDALEPRNADTEAAIVWTLIGLRDTARLNHVLSRLAPRAAEEPRLWGPLAAAYTAINRQAEALRWFRRQADGSRDILWLMAFAESLEANSQPDLAWRIRRKVWMDLRRPEVLAAIPVDQLGSMRDRLAAVAQIFVAGDRAKALVEALLRADLERVREPSKPVALPASGAELAALLADTTLPQPVAAAPAVESLPQGWFVASDAVGLRFPQADNDATVKDLALAWAVNNEAHELARAWLVSRYADALARPLWGRLAVALANGEREALARLLDDLPDWLPMYDRIEAAQRIGRRGLAQTLAFDQMEHLQADEELHARFTSLAVEDPALIGGALAGIRQSPLAIAQARVEASADITPRLKLGTTLTVNRQSTQDETVLINVPQTDATAAVFLRWREERGSATLTAARRSAVERFSTLRLDYDLALAPRLRLAGALGMNQLASETALLRVGAAKDSVEQTLTWNVANREYVRFGLAWNRYYAQDGGVLGRGTLYNLEAGHRVRIEYPDLAVRWFMTRANLAGVSTDNALMAGLVPGGATAGALRYLPESYTQWGLGFGWGLSLTERYTRAIRPFFDFSLFRNSLTGTGHAARVGLAGSLAGQDHLAVYLGQSTGTPSAPQGLREFGLTYRWFY